MWSIRKINLCHSKCMLLQQNYPVVTTMSFLEVTTCNRNTRQLSFSKFSSSILSRWRCKMFIVRPVPLLVVNNKRFKPYNAMNATQKPLIYLTEIIPLYIDKIKPLSTELHVVPTSEGSVASKLNTTYINIKKHN